MASVADGCTDEAQYIKCMKEKYGRDFVGTHEIALGRIIKKDFEDKAAKNADSSNKGHDSHSQTADGKGKWFAEDTREKKEHPRIKLPPIDRTEPAIEDGDVAEYQERIKHLDPFQLRADEFIKHSYVPLEENPNRWHKKIPKWAMEGHLNSKGASVAMFTHFHKVYNSTIKSVSIALERVSYCATGGIDTLQAES